MKTTRTDRRTLAISAAIGAIIGTLGCAHRPTPAAAPEVETIGTLTSSYNSIAVAPVHHDAPPELGGIAGTDDDDAPTATSLDVLAKEAAQVGAVDVAKKTDGVTTGAVR